MSPHPFHPNDHDDLLLPCEVARLFRVDPKTVTRWAKQGHLRSISTLGGHRRYYRSEIEALLTTPPAEPQPSQPPKPAQRAEPRPAGPGTGASGAGPGAWVASADGVHGRVAGGEGDGDDASTVEPR